MAGTSLEDAAIIQRSPVKGNETRTRLFLAPPQAQKEVFNRAVVSVLLNWSCSSASVTAKVGSEPIFKPALHRCFILLEIIFLSFFSYKIGIGKEKN